MKWSRDADQAIKKVPFFVRKKVIIQRRDGKRYQRV